MQAFFDGLLNASPVLVACVVFALVFAEDALFIGFVIPGETAAVVGGVIAGKGSVPLPAMIAVVVSAAILGDTVGYEIGKHLGPRLMSLRIFDRKRPQLEKAQDFLQRRGGPAIFLGRFTAFFRAVMPALAGLSGMPYRRFALWNITGGVLWGSLFVTLGYLAGNLYDEVAHTAGSAAAIVVAAVAAGVLVTWRIRRHRQATDTGSSARPQR
ncbi:DedA family protein [Arthrobacter sp. NPDC058288]|uniref:DedA family protein n=1 Tax=Arthrobacter sp. NPDC058288 TaxID=3346424 RepID=UPI0036E41047